MSAQPTGDAEGRADEAARAESATTDAAAQPHLRPVPEPEPDEPAPAEAAPAAPTTELPEPDSDGETERGWRAQLVAWLTARLRLADLVACDRPSLAKVWRYARYSEQHPPDGPARIASLTFAYGVSLPAHTVGYGLLWAAERSVRAAFAVGIVVLAALFPPTRAVLTVWLWLPHSVIELLTNY